MNANRLGQNPEEQICSGKWAARLADRREAHYFGGLTLLGIGPDNRLYFDGMQLEVRNPLKLTWWQTAIATMASIGALLAGLAALLPFFGITRF